MSNKKVVLKVNGIHCEGCATKIKTSLDSLNANQNVEINVSSGEVKVQFDSEKANLSDIKSKVINAGYQVESVELE